MNAVEVRALPVELMISDVGRRMTALALAALDEAGLSEGGWWVLGALASVEDGLSLVDVAHRTALSSSTVTTVTEQLAERGWIERRRAVDDRRRVLVAITPAGRVVLGQARAQCEQAFAAHHDALSSEEWQQLTTLLGRLHAVAGAAVPQAAP
ncbi:DNA-binding MarR family transcriptional regulator [Actinoplanes octamycinicus]|uniref:DNA-binding MarR family transcriptional regulator n=1 Tax=Actinoplanes octamycinicus TaxID=135948 RepID=A0A7W7MBN0_9ACTN|nr:MarR family winged helix-turn-helix transcriptional regulator [Actinoplanes octamycinicus]MBB4743985.1 DNA-binding MarR family transcriptional regulator [Actinoplanes octamycinicus]